MTIYDESLDLHRKLRGKLECRSRHPLRDRRDLSLLYTPGVAEPSRAIAADVAQTNVLTGRGNTVAVISDGTAVLGLGDIGPHAAMPVMEGKALLFKELGGVDAVPLCIATKDVEAIVQFSRLVAPTFGGINFEDISAPRCFEIEERLRGNIDIPFFHDDQHGTAIVVGAALLNALRVVGKNIADVTIVVNGMGAAGTAIATMLQTLGCTRIVPCDRKGVIAAGHPATQVLAHHRAVAERFNTMGVSGTLQAALAQADVFIGVSGPNLLTAADVRAMRAKPIVLAMANPTPEIMYPEALAGGAAVAATGRSDFPNQVNNVLAFPGVFRGTLDVEAREITAGMKKAACHALAGLVAQPGPEAILPEALDRRVVPAIALAVARAAIVEGVARRVIPDADLEGLIVGRLPRENGTTDNHR